MTFFEVFSALRIDNQELKDNFTDVEVVKVTKTSTNSLARVYILSEHLIHKEFVYMMEDVLKNQVFRIKNMDVRIIDRYKLSKQYTPQKIMDVYYDSILFELEKYWTLEYNLLKNSKWVFEKEDEMTLILEDSFLAHTYDKTLREYFEKVFLNRFGFEIDVVYRYEEKKENNFEKENELLIARRVQEIQERIRVSKADVHDGATGAAIEKKKDSAGSGKSEDKNGAAKPAQPASKADAEAPKAPKFSSDRYTKKPNNPDVLFGRDFDDEPIQISQIQSEMGEVVIAGMVRRVEFREIRNEKTIVMFDVTDFTDTITVKMFARNEQIPELKEFITEKNFLKIKGITMLDKYDHELSISSVTGIRKSSDTRVKRMDHALNKRVELHCHTKMSDMDGVSYAKDLIKQAIAWGHKAIAITDHGTVQAFTDAFHVVRDLEGAAKKKGEDFDFKVIYGVEGYLVDDTKRPVLRSRNQGLDEKYVVFDIETTGFSAENDRIIEIGAVKIEDGEITGRFSTFVNPEVPIPFKIEKLTSINDAMVLPAPKIEEVLPDFLEFCKDCVVVAHNAEFDTGFIRNKAEKQNLEFNNTVVDTLAIARFLLPNLHNFKLDTLTKHFNVSLNNHHRAVDDAEATAGVFLKMCALLKERDINTLDELNEAGAPDTDAIRKMPSYHIILLASSEQGRINLYRLVSASHITYFAGRPRIPKSLLTKYREGIIVGSACEAGDLFQAVLNGAPEEEIARIASFYDYLEIQPLGNNQFMIDSDSCWVKDKQDLIDLNKKIIQLGEIFNKPVVATGDVHFMNPEDEVYRRIVMTQKGFDDADRQAPLYLRTTEEMLAEFEYLDADKAYEIVVTNTEKIMKMCEKIEPVRPDKRPPVIENSDQTLRDICYNRAHEMYGPKLPEIVEERLERELKSIISNGYSVMYIIAQKLVWKSNDDGYLVGSRGSVGSSFAATMAGITEVNPLSPHYLCSNCYYVDFDSDEVKKFAGAAGCDMPDKMCPVCGKKLRKEGFDIPFETFLGFKGNKEPDIDLNFSNEYQSKAHAYTEVIFGKGQTFKAGTIGTVADKTAYGYVKGYFEKQSEKLGRNVTKRNCEMERLAEGCVDIRRTTGQHPGGIVVLPIGEEIHTFTPIQHPANKMDSGITTTHFDYHSIDHNLLKLDILGHLDPTMIRMLQDLTGLDPTEIPLDSPEVMSLFKDTSALGITPDMIGGTKLGALGIPEFGTDFAMQMLIDAKPQYFSDLVRIAGLAHGTDVWLGNAQTLIAEGKATISTAICTRDDIMIYLINMGLDKELSFTIMESVRKGKGLKDEWIPIMEEAGVPDWYIWSCKKIKYMFPKAHAAAYVMMAWRVAYCKVFYPLAYYCAFFSIRADAFSYNLMCMGKDKLEYYIKDYKERHNSKQLSPTEEATYADMRIVQEFYARGFEFMPIDIFRAKARSFQIIDGKIMPSLKAIDGLGEVAAESIEIAARDGAFLSKEDFKARAKVGDSAVNLLDSFGILGNLPDTNQLSLFDI
ncbi:MAG: PolC-type DNA polymerase III [Bacteroides sp.]